MIRKSGQEWCLYSKSQDEDGNRRKLGCYSSKKGAEDREKQVNVFKHMKKKNVKESSMKLTPTKLKTIIHEELRALQQEGAKPLPGTRVKRKSDGMIGYRSVGKKKDRVWSIRWNDGTHERNVPRSDFESVKDAE